MATTVVLGAAAALAIALDRGGSTHVSWTPTESRRPIRVINNVRGNIESFFALNPVPSGHGTVRYVDSAGWAIVYPRSFHGLAHSIQGGTAFEEDDVAFANFTPVPLTAGPPVLSDGVVLAITTTWNHVTGASRLGHDSRFPLHLPASFHTQSTAPWQTTDFDFQGNGVAYHASVIAGSNASGADVAALEQMIASISFPRRLAR